VSGYRILAALLDAAADWADDALAAGAPPKWLTRQMIAITHHAALLARRADAGELIDPKFIFPDTPRDYDS
jgi:hypothetical protein